MSENNISVEVRKEELEEYMRLHYKRIEKKYKIMLRELKELKKTHNFDFEFSVENEKLWLEIFTNRTHQDMLDGVRDITGSSAISIGYDEDVEKLKILYELS